MRVLIAGRTRDLRNLLGEGGEARVYKADIDGRQMAVKIYKGPADPDYAGSTVQDGQNRAGAKLRLELANRKLIEFPKGLPTGVVVPDQLVFDAKNNVLGYTMDIVPGPNVLLRRWSEKDYRQSGVDTNHVLESFLGLQEMVAGLHQQHVVIGDFNDLNVLVGQGYPYLIDADSMQFGKYLCRAFTQRFADPTLCDPAAHQLLLQKPHTPESDWYAFAVMLFQSLLYITPYDGVYRPRDPAKKILHDARPLKRITVWEDEVKYPKFANRLDALPDELSSYFHRVFTDDLRGPFPSRLIAGMRWAKCQCGREHARPVCPNCQAQGVAKEVTRVTGTVTCTQLMGPKSYQVGSILCFQGPALKCVYHDGVDTYYRELGRSILKGPLEPNMRIRVCKATTIMAKYGLWVGMGFHNDGAPKLERFSVDTYQGRLPVVDANEEQIVWCDNDRLLCTDYTMNETVRIGSVIPENTLIWAGPKFGFGFYRAAELSEFFLFRYQANTLGDGVKVPPLKGQLYDATCTFSDRYCWFLASVQRGSQTINRCTLIDSQGQVLAHEEVPAGEEHWLGMLRGKCAAGNHLFCPTDEGIVRVGWLSSGTTTPGGPLIASHTYPDTEPYVSAGTQLFPSTKGLYAVDKQQICDLEMR